MSVRFVTIEKDIYLNANDLLAEIEDRYQLFLSTIGDEFRYTTGIGMRCACSIIFSIMNDSEINERG